MKNSAKKLILSSFITLLVSAGLTSAADVISTQFEGKTTANVLDQDMFNFPAPCVQDHNGGR